MQINFYFALMYIAVAFFVGIGTGRFLGLWRSRPAGGSLAAGPGQRAVPSDGKTGQDCADRCCESTEKIKCYVVFVGNEDYGIQSKKSLHELVDSLIDDLKDRQSVQEIDIGRIDLSQKAIDALPVQ